MRCPHCGRKFPDPAPGKYTMPEHLNYMKTDKCPASGRNFVNASEVPELREPMDARMRELRYAAAMSGILAFAGSPRSRRKR